MKKLVLLIVLLCVVLLQGCDFGKKEPAQPVQPSKQEIKPVSYTHLTLPTKANV